MTDVGKLDLKTASEEEQRRFYDLWLQYNRVFAPDDPPFPFEWYRADWTNVTEVWQMHTWVARQGDRIVGTSGAWIDTQQNLKNAECWVYVTEDARGNDLGRALATPLFDWLLDNGRTLASFRLPEGSGFSGITERAGAKPALRMKRSRLLTADIDRELMEHWVERAQERARDYDVLYLPSPVSDEHLENIAKVQDVMNEAPMEDFIHEDEHTTPELWRNLEKELAHRKDRLLTYVAVHRPTGDFVGFTNLNYMEYFPEQAWVWNTGIDPKHRNLGLGRWVKAAMTLRMLDEYPEVERLDTFNAGSNEAMLNINVEMGFKPMMVQVNWQGDTAMMKERLGV